MKHRPGFLLSVQQRQQGLKTVFPTWEAMASDLPRGSQVGEEAAWSLQVGGRVSPGFSQGHIAAVLFPQLAVPPGDTNRAWETLSKMGLPQVQSDGGLNGG